MDNTPQPPDRVSSNDGKVIQLKTGETNPIPLYVGIGASAGGLEALQKFFENMPPHSPLTFIVIQHLSPDYKSMMVELLSKKTQLTVKRAEDGMLVEPNCIYLIPPKKNLRIFHGQLLLSDQDHSRGINLPIDIFLNSLAEDQSERSAGIVLSGTGSDGMRGIRAIKEQGGLVMVQTEQSAKFDGMPRAAISTGFADFILPPEEMPEKLIAYARHPYVAKSDRSRSIIDDESGLTRVFAMLREKFKIDFTHYKQSTVTRRIERRMTVNQIVDINDYAAFAKNTPSEIATLYRELLIGVTSFFRDPQAYRSLMENWLPAILSDRDRQELRFWVAGCSTGEEAYSIAIAVREGMEKLGVSRDVKIFATDIDRDAISRAGIGIYPESIAADISNSLLMKYFYRRDEHFHVNRNLREMVVFAQHNLIKDPPFTQIDLVTCRNLLIYLQPVLQRKVIGCFNFSIRPGGILMLGLSETVGDQNELFELVDNKNKIYRSRGRSNLFMQREESPMAESRRLSEFSQRVLAGHAMRRIGDEEQTLQRFVDALGGEYIPLSLIVNEQMELRHIVGDSSGLFRLPSGRPVNDISKMAAKELSIPLSTGIQKVYRTRKAHVFSNIQMRRDEKIEALKMIIKPLPEKRGQESLVAVLIEEMAPSKIVENGGEIKTYDMNSEAEQYLRDLENELQFTRENLQATIEELETANEELQATNEELLASNEELQSTNEELQSTNEELHTVNVEYQSKIIELTELNNDVDNLLTTSQVGKLLLDDNLEIRRFSSLLKTIFKVLESDIGRPLTHITHQLVDQDPVGDVRVVMETRQVIEKEVQAKDGHWYLMRILPYQIGPGSYSGVVMTFMDISELKRSRDDLEENNRKLLEAQELANMGNWEYDIPNNRLEWSSKAFDIFEIDPELFEGTYEAFLERVHPEDRDRVDRSYRRSLEERKPLYTVHRLLFEGQRVKFVNTICRTEYDGKGRPLRTVGVFQDITCQQEMELQLTESEARYKALFDTVTDGVVVYKAVDKGKDFEIVDFNTAAQKMERIKKADMVGRRISEAFSGAADSGLLKVLGRVWKTGQPETHPEAYYEDENIAGWRENLVYRLANGHLVTVYKDIDGSDDREKTNGV